jgi:uracil-DNA glycosylase
MSAHHHSLPIQQRLERVVQDIHDHLVLQRDEGVYDVEVEPDIIASVSVWSGPASLHTVQVSREAPPMSASMRKIAERVRGCRLCPLCETRTNTVPGQGSMHPDILFIGEGPGADEDEQGLAFVGRAGKMLTRIIEAMGYTRDEVWIGNIVKCRPPGNRTPLPDEMEACMPYLKEQIALLKPKVIVCLGATAVKGLFQTTEGITKLRGKWMSFEGIDTMPTYHPAYVLRNPAGKRPVWEDMKAVLARLGREAPGGSRK